MPLNSSMTENASHASHLQRDSAKSGFNCQSAEAIYPTRPPPIALKTARPVMTTTFDIRLATPDDAPAISRVIKSLSGYFLTHPDGAGAETVLQSIEPAGIAEFIAAPHFCHWVVCVQGQVIAVAGLRDNTHLYHLFVAKEWQKHGVGRALWQKVMSAALTVGNANAFTVNSTAYGQAVYERFGFTSTGPVTQRDGMMYIPMALKIVS